MINVNRGQWLYRPVAIRALKILRLKLPSCFIYELNCGFKMASECLESEILYTPTVNREYISSRRM